MFNTSLFNTQLYNTAPAALLTGSLDEFVFNGYGLQNANIITEAANIERAPVRDFETVRAPRNNGRIISGDFWDIKGIELVGNLDVDTRTELDQLIDQIKQNLDTQSGNLDIVRGDGVSRRFIATAVEMNFMRDRHFHVSTCPFRLRFECLVPFGQSINYDSTFETIGDLIHSEEKLNQGTAQADAVWIMIVNAATAITAINITNNENSEEIEITETINAGDVIIFNGETKELTINNVLVDYDGFFPKLETGNNSYTITCTGTSIDYDLTVKNKQNYY